MNSEDIKSIVLNQGKAFTEFKKANDQRLKTLEKNLSAFAKKAGRRGIGTSRPSADNH